MDKLYDSFFGSCNDIVGTMKSVTLNYVSLTTARTEPFCRANPVVLTHQMPGVADIFNVKLSQTFPFVRGVKLYSRIITLFDVFQRNVTLNAAPCIVVLLSHLKTADMFMFSD